MFKIICLKYFYFNSLLICVPIYLMLSLNVFRDCILCIFHAFIFSMSFCVRMCMFVSDREQFLIDLALYQYYFIIIIK